MIIYSVKFIRAFTSITRHAFIWVRLLDNTSIIPTFVGHAPYPLPWTRPFIFLIFIRIVMICRRVWIILLENRIETNRFLEYDCTKKSNFLITSCSNPLLYHFNILLFNNFNLLYLENVIQKLDKRVKKDFRRLFFWYHIQYRPNLVTFALLKFQTLVLRLFWNTKLWYFSPFEILNFVSYFLWKYVN